MRPVFQGHDSDRPRRARKVYGQDLERRQIRAELKQRPRHCQEKRPAGEKCEEQVDWTCRRALRRKFHAMRAKRIADKRRDKCLRRRQESGLIGQVGKSDFALSQPLASRPRHHDHLLMIQEFSRATQETEHPFQIKIVHLSASQLPVPDRVVRQGVGWELDCRSGRSLARGTAL